MYELADWGQPVPPDWDHPRERLETRLPANLVRVLRSRARAEGVSMSVLVHRLLSEAMGLSGGPGRHVEYAGSAFDA